MRDCIGATIIYHEILNKYCKLHSNFSHVVENSYKSILGASCTGKGGGGEVLSGFLGGVVLLGL